MRIIIVLRPSIWLIKISFAICFVDLIFYNFWPTNSKFRSTWSFASYSTLYYIWPDWATSLQLNKSSNSTSSISFTRSFVKFTSFILPQYTNNKRTSSSWISCFFKSSYWYTFDSMHRRLPSNLFALKSHRILSNSEYYLSFVNRSSGGHLSSWCNYYELSRYAKSSNHHHWLWLSTHR